MQRIPEALSHKLSNMAFVCACFVPLPSVAMGNMVGKTDFR